MGGYPRGAVGFHQRAVAVCFTPMKNSSWRFSTRFTLRRHALLPVVCHATEAPARASPRTRRCRQIAAATPTLRYAAHVRSGSDEVDYRVRSGEAGCREAPDISSVFAAARYAFVVAFTRRQRQRGMRGECLRIVSTIILAGGAVGRRQRGIGRRSPPSMPTGYVNVC